MTVRANYYDEAFLNPTLSHSLARAASENTRKMLLLSQYASECGNGVSRHLKMRATLRAFAEQNYAPAAVIAGFGV